MVVVSKQGCQSENCAERVLDMKSSALLCNEGGLGLRRLDWLDRGYEMETSRHGWLGSS